jgi:SAM-dependent methyltransferase
MQIRHIVLIVVLVVFGVTTYKYFFKSWTPYFQEKLYKEPRPLLVQGLQIFNEHPQAEKNALDLGAGAGNDTAFLLKNGWAVWANDREIESMQVIATRKDVVPYKEKLTLIHSSFIDVEWNSLPSFNLIYAGYSLPFLDKDSFDYVW